MKRCKRSYKTKRKAYYMEFKDGIDVYSANEVYQKVKKTIGDKLKFGLPPFTEIKALNGSQIDVLINKLKEIKGEL